MLIHRCHLIWGSRKIVTYPLIFIAFATATVGVASWIMSAIGDSNTGIPWKWDMFLKGSDLSSIYNITDTVFNGVLTILTALRIWSITREARAMLGRNVRQRYNGIMAIILESGSLYFAAQITSLVMYFAISSAKLGLIPLDMSLIVIEVAGIAPTLIIVRASLGKSVESVEHVVTTLRFADNLGPEDSQSRGDIPTLGLRVLGDDDGASESNTQITDPKTKNLKSEGAEAV
ncbi:hypothetical protein V5O48_009832 [Marasmius crinis-equi]|uniref:Uncharacterized protein n=1 Tax=Marasmius crinis-equi TaxID=585013 RepID=A0ABR3FA58_9AGAR